jgi:hypothetical protein
LTGDCLTQSRKGAKKMGDEILSVWGTGLTQSRKGAKKMGEHGRAEIRFR